jgi:hypothetical protein
MYTEPSPAQPGHAAERQAVGRHKRNNVSLRFPEMSFYGGG